MHKRSKKFSVDKLQLKKLHITRPQRVVQIQRALYQQKSIMGKLITIANNAIENLDDKVFGKFMKKVTVWGYANINKESYISLSHDDKEKIIRQYNFDIKARSSGKFGPIYCLLCL